MTTLDELKKKISNAGQWTQQWAQQWATQAAKQWAKTPLEQLKQKILTGNTNAWWTTWIKESLKDVKQKEIWTRDGIKESVWEFFSDIWDLVSYWWTELVSNKDTEKWINDWDKYKEYMSKLSSTDSMEEYNKIWETMVNENVINKKDYEAYQQKEQQWEKYKFEQQKSANKQVFFDKLEWDMSPIIANAKNKYQIDSLNKGISQIENQYSTMYDSFMRAYADTRDDNLLKLWDKNSREYEDAIRKVVKEWWNQMINKDQTYSEAYSAMISQDKYKDLANSITTIERNWRDSMYKETILYNFSEAWKSGLNIVKWALAALTGIKNTLTWWASKIWDAIEEGKELAGRYDVVEELTNLRVFDENAWTVEKAIWNIWWFANQLVDTLPTTWPAIIEILLTKKLAGIDWLKQINNAMWTVNRYWQELVGSRRWAYFIQSMLMDNLVYDNVFQLIAWWPISAEDENINMALNVVVDWVWALLQIPAKWYVPDIQKELLEWSQISEDALRIIKKQLWQDIEKVDTKSANFRNAVDKYYLRVWDESKKWYKWAMINVADLPEWMRKIVEAVQSESTKVWDRLKNYQWNILDLSLRAEEILGRRARGLSTLDMLETAAQNIYMKSNIWRTLWWWVYLAAATTWWVAKSAIDKWLISEEWIKAIISKYTKLSWLQDVIFSLIKWDDDMLYSWIAKLWQWANNNLTYDLLNKIYNWIAADLLESYPTLLEQWWRIGNFVKSADWLYRDIFDTAWLNSYTLQDLVALLRAGNEEKWFGYSNIDIWNRLNQLSQELTAKSKNWEIVEQDITSIFNKYTEWFKDSTIAEQNLMKDLFTRSWFKVQVWEDWLLHVFWDVNTIEKYLNSIQKIQSWWLLAMWWDELSALLLSNYPDVVKSYRAYTNNFKWFRNKNAYNNVYNEQKFQKSFKTWTEDLFTKVSTKDWDLYFVKKQFASDDINQKFTSLINNWASFKELEEFAAGNIIADVTKEAMLKDSKDKDLYAMIKHKIEWTRYIKWYDNEILPIVNSVFNQVRWLQSLWIDTQRAAEVLWDIFWKIVVDTWTLKTLANVNSDYFYKAVIARVIAEWQSSRMLYADAMSKVFNELIEKNLDIVPLRVMMDEVEKIKFIDDLETDFLKAKKKFNKDKKSLESKIKSLEKKSDTKAEITIDTSKLQSKIDNLEKKLSKAWTRKEKLELQEQIEELQDKIFKAWWFNKKTNENADELAKAKVDLEDLEKSFNDKWWPYLGKDWSLKLEPNVANEMDRLANIRMAQDWIQVWDHKKILEKIDDLNKRLKNKAEPRWREQQRIEWTTYTNEWVLIHNLSDASDDDLQLISQLVAYNSAAKYQMYNIKQIDKVADNLYYSLKRLKVNWYDKKLRLNLDESLSFWKEDVINLWILWEAQILSSLMNPRWFTKTILWGIANRTDIRWMIMKIQEWIDELKAGSKLSDDYILLMWNIQKYIKYWTNPKQQIKILIDNINESWLLDVSNTINKIMDLFNSNEWDVFDKSIQWLINKTELINKLTETNDWLQDLISSLQAAILLYGRWDNNLTKQVNEINEKLNTVTMIYNRAKEATFKERNPDEFKKILNTNTTAEEMARKKKMSNRYYWDKNPAIDNPLINEWWGKWNNEPDLSDLDGKIWVSTPVWKKFVIYDLETNWVQENQEIIQWAFIIVEVDKNGNLNIADKFKTWLHRGTNKITPEVEKLTKITNAQVSGKKLFKWSDDAKRFAALANDKNVIWVWHNADKADSQWLEWAWIKIWNKTIDTNTLARIFFPWEDSVQLDTIAHRFENVIKWINSVQETKAHDALSDVIETYYLFQFLARHWGQKWIKDIDELIDLSRRWLDELPTEPKYYYKQESKEWDFALNQMVTWYGTRDGIKAEAFVKELDDKFPEQNTVNVADIVPYISQRMWSEKAKVVLEGLLKIIPENATIDINKLFAWEWFRKAWEEYYDASVKANKPANLETFLLNRTVNNILATYNMNSKWVMQALEWYAEEAWTRDLKRKLIQYPNGRPRWSETYTDALRESVKYMHERWYIIPVEWETEIDMINNIVEYMAMDKEALSRFNKLYYDMLQSWTPQSQEVFVNTFKNWISNEFKKKWVYDVQEMENTSQSWLEEVSKLHKLEEEERVLKSQIDEVRYLADVVEEYEKAWKKLNKEMEYYKKLKTRLDELTAQEEELTKTINEKRDGISSPLTKYWNEGKIKPDLDSKYVNAAIHDYVLERLNKTITKTVDNIRAGVDVYTMSDVIWEILVNAANKWIIKVDDIDEIWNNLDKYHFWELYEAIIDWVHYWTINWIFRWELWTDLVSSSLWKKLIKDISEQIYKRTQTWRVSDIQKSLSELWFWEDIYKKLDAQAWAEWYRPLYRAETREGWDAATQAEATEALWLENDFAKQETELEKTLNEEDDLEEMIEWEEASTKRWEQYENQWREDAGKMDSMTEWVDAEWKAFEEDVYSFLKDDMQKRLMKAWELTSDSKYEIVETAEWMRNRRWQRFNIWISTWARVNWNNKEALLNFLKWKAEPNMWKEWSTNTRAQSASINAYNALIQKRTDLYPREAIEEFGIEWAIWKELSDWSKIEKIWFDISFKKIKEWPEDIYWKKTVDKEYMDYWFDDITWDKADVYKTIQYLFQAKDWISWRARMIAKIKWTDWTVRDEVIYLDIDDIFKTSAGKYLLEKAWIDSSYWVLDFLWVAEALSDELYWPVSRTQELQKYIREDFTEIQEILKDIDNPSKWTQIWYAASDKWDDDLLIAMLNKWWRTKWQYIPKLPDEVKTKLMNDAINSYKKKLLNEYNSTTTDKVNTYNEIPSMYKKNWDIARWQQDIDKADTWKEIFWEWVISYEKVDEVVSEAKVADNMGEFIFDTAKKEWKKDWKKKLGRNLLTYDNRFKSEINSAVNNSLVYLYKTLDDYKQANRHMISGSKEYPSLYDKLLKFEFTTKDGRKYKLLWYRQDYIITNKWWIEYENYRYWQTFNAADDYDDIMYVEGKNWIYDEESRYNDWRDVNKPLKNEYDDVSYIMDPKRIVVKMQSEETWRIIYWEIVVHDARYGNLKDSTLSPDTYTQPTTYEFIPFREQEDPLGKFKPATNYDNRADKLSQLEQEELEAENQKIYEESLWKEYRELKKKLRAAQAEKQRAASLWDLSENAEYQWAKEDLEDIKNRVKTLEAWISERRYYEAWWTYEWWQYHKWVESNKYEPMEWGISWKLRWNYKTDSWEQREKPETLRERSERLLKEIEKDWDEFSKFWTVDNITNKIWNSRMLIFTNYDIANKSADLRQIIWMRSKFIQEQWEALRDAIAKFQELTSTNSKEEMAELYDKIKNAAYALKMNDMWNAMKVEVKDLPDDIQKALDDICDVYVKGWWNPVYQLTSLTKDWFDWLLKNTAHNHLASAMQYFQTWSRKEIEKKLRWIVWLFETDEKRILNTVSDIIWDPLNTGKFFNFMTWVRSAWRFVKYWPLMPLAGTLMLLNSAVMWVTRYAGEKKAFQAIMDTDAFGRLIKPKADWWLWFASSLNRVNEIMFNSNSDLWWSWFDRVLDVMLKPLPKDAWMTKYLVAATKGWIHSIFDVCMEWSIKAMAVAKALAKNEISEKNIDNFIKLYEEWKIDWATINNILADVDMIYSRFFTNSATTLFSRHRFSRWFIFNALQWYVINRTDEMTSSIKDAVNWIYDRWVKARQVWDWKPSDIVIDWNDFTEYMHNENQELQSFLMNVLLSAKMWYYFDKSANQWDYDWKEYFNYWVDTSDYLSSIPATFFTSILMAPFEWMDMYIDYTKENYNDFNLWQWLTVWGVKLLSTVMQKFFREWKILNALTDSIVAYGKYWDAGFSYDVLLKEFEKINSWLGRFQLQEGTNLYWLTNMTEEWDLLWQILFNWDKTSYAGKLTNKVQDMQTVDSILNWTSKDFFENYFVSYIPIIWNAIKNAISWTWYSFSAAKYDQLQHIMDKDNIVQTLLDFDPTVDWWLFSNPDIYSDEAISRLYKELVAFDYSNDQYKWNSRFNTWYEWTMEPIKEEVFTKYIEDYFWEHWKELANELAKVDVNSKKWVLKIMAAAEAYKPGSEKIIVWYLANKFERELIQSLTENKYWSWKDLSEEQQNTVQRLTVENYYPEMITADKTSWYKAITEYISWKYPVFEELYKDDDLSWYVSTLWYMDMLMYMQAREWEVHSSYIKNSWTMLSKYFKTESARITAVDYVLWSIENAGFSKQKATMAKMWVLAANMDFYDKLNKNAMTRALYWDDIERYNNYVWWTKKELENIDLSSWNKKYSGYAYKPYTNYQWETPENTKEVWKFIPQANKYLKWWTPSWWWTSSWHRTSNPYTGWDDLKWYRKYYEGLIKDYSDKLVRQKSKTYPAQYTEPLTFKTQSNNRWSIRWTRLTFPKHKSKQYRTNVISNLPGSHW